MKEKKGRLRVSNIAVFCLLIFVLLSLDVSAASAQTGAAVKGPLVPGEVTLTMPNKFDLGKLGYQEIEFIFSGTAASYQSTKPLSADGKWTTKRAETAPYESRFFVRRPTDSKRFNGTVYVEWLNVTGGGDNDVLWKYTHNEIIRQGAVYIGVAAQMVGVNHAKKQQPDRYKTLNHPGDVYSFDIFTQAGQVIGENTSLIIPGLKPKYFIALGESQSAIRLRSYLNGVVQHGTAFDGFLLMSDFAGVAALDDEPRMSIDNRPIIRVRDDLDVPVLSFETELEVGSMTNDLDFARQPDTKKFRLWEIPGSSHVGTYFYNIGIYDDGSEIVEKEMADAVMKPTVDKDGGGECDAPINDAPSYWILNAALRKLHEWVAEGKLPPKAPYMATATVEGKTVIARDRFGNALGGIRTPYLDAPVAHFEGTGYGKGFCFLNGMTVPLSEAMLQSRYKPPANFLAEWTTSASDAVQKGFILTDDLPRLLSIGKIISELLDSERRFRQP
jgi:hypothetical protein